VSAARRPRVLVIHGPNLNLLGEREPGVYGSGTLAELDASLQALADELGVDLTIRQSNHEGNIIDWIHGARAGQMSAQDGLVINPGGFTHTSVAIHDALRAVSIPVVEVHLSNLYRRESFRHESVTGVACAGIIMGLGHASYLLALRHLAGTLK
jgi:3-dehydroquinate dehydratase-2